MAELREGDRVFVRKFGFYGILKGCYERREDGVPVFKVQHENKPTDGFYCFSDIIKLHPEDQPGGGSSSDGGGVDDKDLSVRPDEFRKLAERVKQMEEEVKEIRNDRAEDSVRDVQTLSSIRNRVDENETMNEQNHNQICELMKRVEHDEKKMEENDGSLHNELCTLIHRVEALEKARQQDVENSRQMKEMLVNMVKQWENEDGQQGE